jgi:hypothetical protein
MTVDGTPPAPPQGPGLQPPFVSPPTDGTTRRRWIAAGVATAVAIVCCLGGIFGIGALVNLQTTADAEKAKQVVTEYLTALQNENYGHAYALLCDNVRQATTPDQFAAQESSRRVGSFTVHDASVGDSQTVVTASVNYVDGTTAQLRYILEATSAGAFEICDVTG